MLFKRQRELGAFSTDVCQQLCATLWLRSQKPVHQRPSPTEKGFLAASKGIKIVQIQSTSQNQVMGTKLADEHQDKV